jgi:hypothetical protein
VEGAAVQAESSAGAWAGKGGSDNDTHQTHKNCGHRGAYGHRQGTRTLRLETRMGLSVGTQSLFQGLS